MDVAKFAKERQALEALKLEIQKEQERIAIRSIVSSTQSKVKSSGQKLQTTLDSGVNNVKQLASHTMVSQLTPVFEGKAADSAKGKLTQLRAPSFPNLVR